MDDLIPLSWRIWDMKYRLRDADGAIVDVSPDDTMRRVANALAANETGLPGADTTAAAACWADHFFDAMAGFRFLPAGRILSGAGTRRRTTLFNCFVMGTIEDDMGSIFSHLREAAITLQYGGGIGYDFSTIRPKGAGVSGAGSDASGPLSFMDVWDAMCRTITGAGSRRGAMMAVLRCDHPDIEAFIDAKAEPRRLRMFNLSVAVTDAFMAAIDRNDDWTLMFAGRPWRTVNARALWDRIMRATYDFAEPGVIFIDRVNAANSLSYCETIAATNPCGEQPLPPYGACLLGSVNLARLVRHPFADNAELDEDALAATVATGVRMLDNAIDCSLFPLPRQEAEAKAKRRIGLGVTGLADALIYCGVRYGSPRSIALIDRWMTILRRSAWRASAALAAEKGPFPLFDRDRYLDRPMIRSLDAETRALVATNGTRNALLTSIAPTGTISLFANGVSSGIEPVFAWRLDRAILGPDGARTMERVDHPALAHYARHLGYMPKPEDLPDAFVDAQHLSPEDHLAVQAAVQRHIDSAISKTINCPADLPFDRFKTIYRSAFDLGCKGCTTWRPNEITGSVLSMPALAADPPSLVDEGVTVAPEPCADCD